LVVTSAVIMIVGAWLPVSPLAESLGFTPLPEGYWPFVGLTLICYVLLTQCAKVWLLRKRWI
jgi:Mg2+-importing ATPase